MINDQLSLDFAGASEGMLPTTSCSLPSSSGISFMIRSPESIDADTLFHFVNVTPKPKSLRIEAVDIHGKTRYALITSDNARCLTATLAECLEMKQKMENAI